ncbi:unnamed protein product [Durusdinium trenchii]|uniref:RING-type domain-containing protein n=1 Tax=Durusdinium trenchii TaxID=1381693 RepID=A0ABP0RX35_9DINO
MSFEDVHHVQECAPEKELQTIPRQLPPLQSRWIPPADLDLDWQHHPELRSHNTSSVPSLKVQSNPSMASMPIIHNVPNFDRPSAYAAALRIGPRGPVPCGSSASQSSVPSQRGASSKSSTKSQSSADRRRRPLASPIDQAIRRELVGDGIALEEVVANKRSSGWAVKQRQAQRNDLGHFCYGCKQLLRDLNEEVTVWTGAAIYRRFHPACAASYMLRADGSADRQTGDIVEGYADGWRAPKEYVRPVEAARQWLLSEDQRAWGSLRGDLFTTVTVTENGKKKAVPGLSHDQLRILQNKHRWVEDSHLAEPIECAICFCAPGSALCIRLPCAPQHVFHMSCVLPWLKKASLCPTCRKDLRAPWSKRRGALLALGLAISAICSVAWRTTTTEFGGRFDPATLSVGDLLRMFTETREYLYASGWREQDGTFVPRGQRLGEPKASTPRQFEMKRFTERVSKKNACGAGIRDVMHFTAQLPDVDAQYVMEALTNPGFTNWNPSLHFVMFRRHRRIPLDANLKDTFTPEEMEVKGGYRSLEQSRKTIDVSAQVAEIQIPRVVQKAAGRRFTSDFIAVRYDCKANRGFSIATSVGTEAVAEAAGVRKQQDLCLTSIMVAPGVNSSDTTAP